MSKPKKQRVSTKAPLLPTTNANTKGRSTRYGSCVRFVLLLFPILACACTIGSLYLLMARTSVPISEATISKGLADTPHTDIVVLISIGATMAAITSAIRNVQINIYHRRLQSESARMRTLNLIAAIANTLAYAGIIMLVQFDINGPDPSPLLHYMGAAVFFSLTGLYGVLHAYLLFKQNQYPTFCKIIFTMVPIAAIACILIFLATQRYEFEWFSVALHAFTIGLVSILFMVDPVDDELRDFFCCRRQSQMDQSSPTKA